MITLHSIRVRVYYEDTDAGGIVYYANYLRFFERARTDWLRAVGISQQELARVEGFNLVVRDCAVQYLRPARLDDLLEVEVGLADPAADIGRASLRFAQRALRLDGAGGTARAGGPNGSDGSDGSDGSGGAEDATVLATGTVRVACVDRRSGRPVALPRGITEIISQQVSMQHSTRVTPDGTAQQQ